MIIPGVDRKFTLGYHLPACFAYWTRGKQHGGGSAGALFAALLELLERHIGRNVHTA
jgi:hypothetical protein